MNTDVVVQQIYDVLNQNINIGIVILCFIVGFILKHLISGINNNWIPVVLLVFGILFSIAFDYQSLKSDTMRILITGIASAAIAIGLHQSGKTLFINDKKTEESTTNGEDYNLPDTDNGEVYNKRE